MNRKNLILFFLIYLINFFMAMFIKFGDYNNNYKYLLLVVIFNFLTYYIIDGNLSHLFFQSLTIGPNNTHDNLYIHPYFIDSINYLGIIIISIILYKIRGKQSGINNQNNENKLVNVSEIRLIHNDIKKNLNQNISFLNFFKISFHIKLLGLHRSYYKDITVINDF